MSAHARVAMARAGLPPTAWICVPPGDANLRIMALPRASLRLDNALGRQGIMTLGDLDRRSISDVARLPGLGRATFGELVDVLVAKDAIELTPQMPRLRRVCGERHHGAASSNMSWRSGRIRVPAEHAGVPIADIVMISIRLENALRAAGFATLGALDGLHVADIRRLRNIGAKTLAELCRVLRAFGAIEGVVATSDAVKRLAVVPSAPRGAFDVPFFAHDYLLSDIALRPRTRHALMRVAKMRSMRDLHGKRPRDLYLLADAATEVAERIEDIRARGPAVPGGVVDALDLALDRLDARHREILLLRFGGTPLGPQSLRNVADRYSVSPQRVQQLSKRILAHLRVLAGPAVGLALRDLEGKGESAARVLSSGPPRGRRARDWDRFGFYAALILHLVPGLKRRPTGRGH